MIPVTVPNYWNDNYGLAVLQQLQDLMGTRWFVGLLILGIAALITAITTVIVAAISLTNKYILLNMLILCPNMFI